MPQPTPPAARIAAVADNGQNDLVIIALGPDPNHGLTDRSPAGCYAWVWPWPSQDNYELRFKPVSMRMRLAP